MTLAILAGSNRASAFAYIAQPFRRIRRFSHNSSHPLSLDASSSDKMVKTCEHQVGWVVSIFGSKPEAEHTAKRNTTVTFQAPGTRMPRDPKDRESACSCMGRYKLATYIDAAISSNSISCTESTPSLNDAIAYHTPPSFRLSRPRIGYFGQSYRR